MPIPVSFTAMAMCSASLLEDVTGIAVTVTSPCSVNFKAFEIRLSRICRNFTWSVSREPTPFSILALKMSFRSIAIDCVSSTTEGRSSLKSIWLQLTSIRPASIFDRSSTSLIITSRCFPFFRMRSRSFFWRWLKLALPELFNKIWLKPIMEVKGVRNSCDMVERNWLRARLAASRAEFKMVSSSRWRRSSLFIRSCSWFRISNSSAWLWMCW